MPEEVIKSKQYEPITDIRELIAMLFKRCRDKDSLKEGEQSELNHIGMYRTLADLFATVRTHNMKRNLSIPHTITIIADILQITIQQVGPHSYSFKAVYPGFNPISASHEYIEDLAGEVKAFHVFQVLPSSFHNNMRTPLVLDSNTIQHTFLMFIEYLVNLSRTDILTPTLPPS